MLVAEAVYTNAGVEWFHTSAHGTVALRPGGGPVAHFCEFANPLGLAIATCAGLQGKTVNFTTSGESEGIWRNVQITGVN